MRSLLLVGGPYDGSAAKVPDHVTTVAVESGQYRRRSLSAEVDVFDFAASPPDRWEPRRRVAHFGVDRKPFMR